MDYCQYPHCEELPKFICTCSEKQKKVCQKHHKEHVVEKTNCKPIRNFIEIDSDQIELLTIRTEKATGMLRDIRTKVINESNRLIAQVIEITNKSLDKIERYTKVITNALSGAEVKKIIVKSERISVEDKYLLKGIEDFSIILEEIKEIERFCLYEMDLKAKVNERISRALDNLGIANSGVNWDNFDSIFDKNDSNSLCYFDQNTKNLNVIDISAQNDLKHSLNALESNWSIFSAFCFLPNNRYFTYGSFLNDSTYKDLSFIVNLTDLSIIQCSSYKPKAYMGECIIFNNSIFVYGGKDPTGILSSSEQYNLADNSWTTIEPLPSPSIHNAVTLIYNKVLLTGYNLDYAYIYDTQHNQYVRGGKVTQNQHKRVFKVHEKMTILDNGRIYQSVDNDFANFEEIGTSVFPTNSHSLSPPIQRGIYIYLLQSDFKIYRFNILRKSLELFRSIQ
jgi:hypothetical protein